MKFDSPLIKGKFLRRYKRFFVDIEMPDGDIIVAHCANTGSMKGLMDEGNLAYAKHVDDPKRKLQYTLKMIETPTSKVGVDTSLPNALVAQAVGGDEIPELLGYDRILREQKYGENSRIDILLTDEEKPDCYIEVKNVTLREGDAAMFPDAVTTRGLKHLKELQEVIKQGKRAVMFFVVQRMDCEYFAPAAHIDPDYAKELRAAVDAGVEILCYECDLDEDGIALDHPIEVKL